MIRVKSPLGIAVVILVMIGAFYAFTHISLPSLGSLKLEPRITSIGIVDQSHVTVKWKILNEGDDPAFFKSCTIELGGSQGVAGVWTGGNTGIVFLGSQKRFTTLVKVTSGSANLVTVSRTKVSCEGLVNAHAGN